MTDFLIVNVLIPLAQIAVVLIVVALVIAYTVYAERKILGFIHSRLGPMRVGPHGLLQPIADGVKLLLKEDIRPGGADLFMFLIAPMIGLVTAFTALSLVPFSGGGFSVFGYEVPWVISDVNIGILLLLAIGSLSTYAIILGGWSSNSKYPLLGAMRAAAQMVSYEVALAFAVLSGLMVVGSLNMSRIVEAQLEMGVWLVFVQPLAFVLFLIAMIAETNRLPFDMPEAESELVGGFFTEYSGFRWALFFLGEYGAMIVMAAINTTLFWGGWLRPFPNVEALAFLDLVPGPIWFSLKTLLFIYLYIWIRGTYPRYRYDQLMAIGWKVLIPLSIANLIVTGIVMLLIA
jgi:NADH-quinone oxidoreductase subunit H